MTIDAPDQQTERLIICESKTKNNVLLFIREACRRHGGLRGIL